MKNSSPKDAAMRLLVMREHSTLELYNKLLLRDFDPFEITVVLDELEASGYLSNQRFAECYIRYRASKGLGAIKIGIELEQRGVAKEQIGSAIEDSEINWAQLAKKSLIKKFGNQKAVDFQTKSKQYRFLVNRGFSGSQINQVIDRADDDDQEY